MGGPEIVLILLAVSYAALFIWLSVARHNAFQSHAFDLGNMDQAVWNTVHGRLLRFTDMDVGGNTVVTSRLAIHVEPLLIPLSALYLVHSGPETLLVLQAAVVATGVFPAYYLARRFLHAPWLSLVFPFLYVAHPSLQNALLDDFHTVTLTAALLLWALYYLAREAQLAFLVAALLAMSTKEEVSLTVATLGVPWFLLGYKRMGLLLALVGVAWFLVCMSLIIPHFNPAHASPYFARYAYLGHGPRGVVVGILTHPSTVWNVLTDPARLTYLSALLSPAGYLPALAFPVLLLVWPAIVINMLSADPTMYSGFYQYSAELIPFVVASALATVVLIERRSPRAARVALLLCVVASFWSAWQYGFTPLANGYIVPAAGPHQALEGRAIRSFPSSVVVAAADEIEPHLSDRRTIYLLPQTHPHHMPPAQDIVLDASIPSLPVSPVVLHAVAVRALRAGYGVAFARDGILVLRRGLHHARLLPSFFSFLYRQDSRATRRDVTWGPLHLQADTLHPRDGLVTRSRPAVGVDTYWSASEVLPSTVHITLYMSPVYASRVPPFSLGWQHTDISPAFVWLPLSHWPVNRTVYASFIPLTPDLLRAGRVVLALGVSGLGDVQGGRRLPGHTRIIYLGSMQVGY